MDITSMKVHEVSLPLSKEHPVLRGIENGDIWGPTDVYGVLPLPGDSKPLVLGQVLENMNPDSTSRRRTKEWKKNISKNDPMMPVAWVKSYSSRVGLVVKSSQRRWALQQTWFQRESVE